MQDNRFEYEFSEQDFNHLPQLDRIEYRQKEELINKKYNSHMTSVVIWCSDIFIIWLTTLVVAGYGSIGKSFALLMIEVIFYLIMFFGAGLMIAAMYDSKQLRNKRRELKNLKNSYYKIEVKKR